MRIMLPIIFRRGGNRYAYRQNSYRPYRRNKRSGGRGCAAVILAVVLIITTAWALWYYWPLSDAERKGSTATLTTETRYVISAGGEDIMTFTTARGDTLLNGIGVPGKATAATITTGTQPTVWVRWWEPLPYNGHRLMTEAYDTADICRLQHADIAALLARQAAFLNTEQAVTRQRLDDIAYFLSTHTVLDEGFDIVARCGTSLESNAKTLAEAHALVTKAMAAKNLRIRLDRRYYLVNDTTKARTECEPQESTDSTLLLRPATEYDRPATWQRLEKRDSVMPILKRWNAAQVRPRTAAIDSIGEYSGRRDSLARPHGYGRLHAYNGDFYEGEWTHGRRNGVGFSMVPGQRLQLGEWKEDRYLGQKITYTPQRIYGIDISRHQHEKGRKRYSINWKNLRITSLGTKSEKNIHGEVDYPVRFIFIKATEGTTVRNRYFASDYTQSRKHGYRTGAYHFFSTKTTGKRQAEHFLRNSRYNKGDLPPVLDLEPTDGAIKRMGGVSRLFSEVRQWLSIVEKRRGARPILYISQRFVNKYLPQAPDLLRDYDVWIARYGQYKPDVHLVYWQLSADGRVNGIHGDVDINVYNGFDF